MESLWNCVMQILYFAFGCFNTFWSHLFCNVSNFVLHLFVCMYSSWPQRFCIYFPEDVTMVICPGIGNHSEKHYIRTFVDYSQKQGYRCAVLNHLGALPNIELTSPRMFTYGKTPVWRYNKSLYYNKEHLFNCFTALFLGNVIKSSTWPNGG